MVIRMIQNMTSGNPTKLIIQFTIPLLIGNIFQQLYSISDIIIVGRLLGVNALAAVGATGPIFFLLLAIIIGFTSGLTVITAQRFGAGDYKGMRRSVATSTIISLSFTVISSLGFIWVMPPLLRLMNVPEEIMQDAYNFIVIICGGLIMFVLYNLLSGFLRALGDSRTPLYFLIFTSLINIALNYFLIGFCGMDVRGSALGTIISLTISSACCIWWIKRKFSILIPHPEDHRFDWEFYKEHPVIRFTTKENDGEYEIISAFKSKVFNKSDTNVFRYYNFMNAETEAEYNEFVENSKKASLYDIEATAEYGDELITLITCSYHTTDGRFVIVARKEENDNKTD